MRLWDLLPWSHVPAAVRKRVRNYLLATFVAAGAAVVLGLGAKPLGIPARAFRGWGRWGPLTLGLILALIPIVVLWPMFLRSQQRLRSQFNEAGGRLCTHCGYNVNLLGERGTCPPGKCGGAFDAEADAAVWEGVGFKCEK